MLLSLNDKIMVDMSPLFICKNIWRKKKDLLFHSPILFISKIKAFHVYVLAGFLEKFGKLCLFYTLTYKNTETPGLGTVLVCPFVVSLVFSSESRGA